MFYPNTFGINEGTNKNYYVSHILHLYMFIMCFCDKICFDHIIHFSNMEHTRKLFDNTYSDIRLQMSAWKAN